MRNFTARITPFIILGIALVALVFGLILLSYLLIVGALVGLGLFVVSMIREKFFPSKAIVKRSVKRDKPGTTFDHDDFV